MATAGFAVGLGNIWRFPYVTGSNGGAAFLLVYVAFSALIGIPLLTAEIGLGRKLGLSPLAGMRKATGSASHPWNAIGWMGTATATIIMGYYLMLLGWIAGYLVMAISGDLAAAPQGDHAALYESFIARPGMVLAYTGAVTAVMCAIVWRGVRHGVERLAKVGMPLFFVILLALAIRSLTFPGAAEGLAWYLRPDFSALDGEALLIALGQAFYSIGIGMAAAFRFESYLDTANSDVPGNAAIVVAFDTMVAFIAGLVLFPALFAFGLEPDAGPGLLFVTMANLFGRMPAGQLLSIAFFFLLLLAGVTTAVAQIEVLVATLEDSWSIGRTKGVILIGSGLLLLNVPVVLSQGPWSDFTVFGMDLFVLTDYVSGSLLLPIGALALALYIAISWGWHGFRDDLNQGAGTVKVAAGWKPFVMVLIPLAVATILLVGLGVVLGAARGETYGA
jgi:NSS family neurotransmitter:Na+ symporter